MTAPDDGTLEVVLEHQDWEHPKIVWSDSDDEMYIAEYPSDILQFAKNLTNLRDLPELRLLYCKYYDLRVHVRAPNEYDVTFSNDPDLVQEFMKLLDHLNEFPHIRSIEFKNRIVGIDTIIVKNYGIKTIDVTGIGNSLIAEIINRHKDNYAIRATMEMNRNYQTRYLNHPNVSYYVKNIDTRIMQGCIYMTTVDDSVDYARFFNCVDGDVRYIQVPSIMVADGYLVNRYWRPLFNFVRAHPNVKLGAYHIPRPIQQQEQQIEWWFTLPQFDSWNSMGNIISYHDGNLRGLIPKYKGYIMNRDDKMDDEGVLVISTLDMSVAMLKTIKNQIEKTPPQEKILVYDPQTDRIYHPKQVQFKLMSQTYHLGMELTVDERQFYDDEVNTNFNGLITMRTRADYYGHNLFNTIPIHYREQIPIVDYELYPLRNPNNTVHQGIIFYRIPAFVRGEERNYHLLDARLRSYGVIPYNSDTLDPPEFARSIIGFMYLYATYNRLTYMGVRLSNDILQELRWYLFHTPMNREELMNDLLNRIHRLPPRLTNEGDILMRFQN